jgi:uncharacterized protein HemY
MTDFTIRFKNWSPVPILPHQRWIFKRQTSTKVHHHVSNLARKTWRNQISLLSPVEQAMRIVRDAPRALELAKSVVNDVPERGGSWFTFALAHYRNGDWQSADDAVQHSIKLARDGDANTYNGLLLAMIRTQQGRTDEARQWQTKAEDWIVKNDPSHEDEVLSLLATETSELQVQLRNKR